MRRRSSHASELRKSAKVNSVVAEQTSESPSEPGASTTNEFSWPPLLPEFYFNRELSWLEFNHRVLDEAEDPTLPLLERCKFAAIFSTNLDEFFMIRVAGVKRKLTTGRNEPGPDGRTPQVAALAIQARSQDLLDRHAALVRGELIPALAAEGIQILDWSQLTEPEHAALSISFERDIFPVLTPQAVDRARRFPHVSNQSLNLLVVLRSTVAGFRFARVKIPALLPRLVRVPEIGETDPKKEQPIRLIWLEQVVAAHLTRLFPGNDVMKSYPFHVIRDSDFDVDEDEDDAHDLLSSMQEFLQQRTFGQVVQVMTDRAMPDDVRTWLVDQLHAVERDSYVIDGPLCLENLMELLSIDRPDLKVAPYLPRHTDFASLLGASELEVSEGIDIWAVLRERDVLVHHPYQSFSIIAEFLKRAATDRDVVAIKETLYRIGKDSPLVPSLIEARDDDTQVAVLVELKARFDEENNISLAQRLEQHGVHVAYGVHGLKTHCKATLVVRREADGLRRYVHLSTGNYNAGTARVYEDLGIITSRDDIGSDVMELFNVLTGFSLQNEYRKLLVAPSNLRDKIIERIQREVDSHRANGKGRLIFKMNSLVDRETIRALYGASQAGVKIDLIIRGICCLRPGVKGWSENIRVISIVGRFLEHSRIYYFGNGGDEELYLGSADLMERNLDRRVEAVFPVEDEGIRRHILDDLIGAYLRDSVNARILHEDGSWTLRRPAKGEKPFDAQAWMTTIY
jgi:polyphosphate kinase